MSRETVRESLDPPETVRGSLDLILLAALRREPAHGYGLIRSVRALSQDAFDLKEGVVYPVLHRLEGEGLVASRWAQVDGRRRRVYRLTRHGQAWLVKRERGWRRYVTAVDAVVSGALS